MSKVLIVTGGSGGHVIPALTIYDHIKSNIDVKVMNQKTRKHEPNTFWGDASYLHSILEVINE